MWKIFDNLKFELIGLTIFYFFYLLESFGVISTPYISGILMVVALLYYFVKLARSFKDWKSSKGACFINFFLNLEIFCVVMGTSYLLIRLPGGAELLHSSLLLPQFLLMLIAIVLAINWNKKHVYWELIKINVYKGVFAIFISIIFFYAIYDLPTYMRKGNEVNHGWIKLY
jgi:hypothetical protein